MIALSVVAIFLALFLLVYMALPGRRVSRKRLGIERERLNLGQSVEKRLGAERQRRLAQALSLADVKTEPGQFVLRIAVMSVLLAIVGLLLSPVLGLVLLFVPYAVARTWVGHKATKRTVAFADQLPVFLRSVVMSLRSGFGLSQAIEAAAQEAQEPLRSEIERVQAEVRMGRSLSEAMHSLSERMQNADLEWVVGAIDINRQTGGNLSDILATVNDTIRDRQRIQRKVNTFTAEGRMSAKILTAAPFLFALWQWRAHPEGFAALFHGTGLLVLLGSGALMIVGWFWIKRVVTIKI
jgi:tight adherence protein B